MKSRTICSLSPRSLCNLFPWRNGSPPRSTPLGDIQHLPSPVGSVGVAKYSTTTGPATSDTQHHPPLSRLFSVEGKTAICTGITGGLGKELCTTLAEAGVNIVSIQFPGDPAGSILKEAMNLSCRNFISFECDLSDSKSIRNCFQDIWRADIVPDILLNAAGLNRRGKVYELEDEDIDAVLAVNLKSSFVTSQEFAKKMIELERPGKIINIGSMTSFLGMYNVAAYASSKGGVLQMTKAFSNELAERGIQVNCICPGYYKTPLTVDIVKDKEYNDFVLKRTPAKRWGEPKDLRGALIFLSSSASDFVTGSPVIVDGGMLGK